MSNPPPIPRSLLSPPTLYTLRNCLAVEKRSKESTWNLARSMLKAGTRITYKKVGESATHLADVVEVTGVPGRIRVLVEKVSNAKRLGIALEDITGIVQEN